MALAQDSVPQAARRATSPSVRLRVMVFAMMFGMLSLGAPLAAGTRDALVIVVNDASSLSALHARNVRKLFLGKQRSLSNGATARLATLSRIDSDFNRRVLMRSDAQVAAAWARLRFSGRAIPPHRFDSIDDVLRYLADTPDAMAVLPAAVIEGIDSVRTVYAVPD